LRAENACADTWRTILGDLGQIKLAQLSGPMERPGRSPIPGPPPALVPDQPLLLAPFQDHPARSEPPKDRVGESVDGELEARPVALGTAADHQPAQPPGYFLIAREFLKKILTF
jgi:hypothetical protein